MAEANTLKASVLKANVLEARLPGARIISTTRVGGVSTGRYESWNLGDHVGDVEQAVAENRSRLQQLLPAETEICWLRQVHGNTVVHAASGCGAEADAVWSDDPGYACAVMTADCLPIVLADGQGSCVAAIHGGWRGLAAGVIAETLNAMPVSGTELSAWLGPAIGPNAFEVGEEVRSTFLDAVGTDADTCFKSAGTEGKWLADLYGLARQQLSSLGVSRISGGAHCTFTEADQFFSHRRDGPTGRMATLVWLETT